MKACSSIHLHLRSPHPRRSLGWARCGTGFRLGYAVAKRPALRTLQILAQNLFISASEFVQQAGLGALAHGEAHVQGMRAAYTRRRDVLVDGLRALGFGVAHAPEGAFYVLADARRFDADSRRPSARLLEEAHVAVTPGIDFGAAGEGFLRFCYASSTTRSARRSRGWGGCCSLDSRGSRGP